jgi:quercetin dioxygenase-like cupin family protein
LRFPAGYVEPRHYHTTAGHSIYVLSGRINFAGIEAPAGDFFYTPPNVVHDLVALEESEILIWSDGPLDFHLSEEDVEE